MSDPPMDAYRLGMRHRYTDRPELPALILTKTVDHTRAKYG